MAASTKVNCTGSWSPCSLISTTQTYTVATPAAAGGAACPNKTGDTQACPASDYSSQIQAYLLSNMTTNNFMMLIYILIGLAVIKGLFSTIRDFFGGGGGGGGKVTVIS